MPRSRLIYVNSERGETETETFEFPPSALVRDVKADWERRRHVRIGNLFFAGRPVPHDRLVVSVNGALTWTVDSQAFRVVEGDSLRTLAAQGDMARAEHVFHCLRAANHAASAGVRPPQRTTNGSGGAYFLTDAGSPPSTVACFKPRDEEPGMKNSVHSAPQRAGVLPGESAERECAAFLLDWKGFCGVPGTVLVEAPPGNAASGGTAEPRIGSFQAFVNNASETAGDFSPHFFNVREVHKIGLLDLRYLNMDRNDSNILVVKDNGEKEFRLVPIDHGLCFPDRIEVGWCDWVWFDWPQTLMPFDHETKQWVASLDIDMDARILEKFYGMRAPCIRAFRCASLLLKKGVAAGLTLRDIASVVVRSRDIDEPSAMEKTISRAMELATIMHANSRSKAGGHPHHHHHQNSDNNNNNNNNHDNISPSDKESRATATGGKKLNRSSSFDASTFPSVNGGNQHRNITASSSSSSSKTATTPTAHFAGDDVPDELLFTYVNRLLEDVVAEIIHRKRLSPSAHNNNNTNLSGSDGDSSVGGAWFSVSSSHRSPTELTTIASPRLSVTAIAAGGNAGRKGGGGFMPMLDLQQ